jgi:hypothetical protein
MKIDKIKEIVQQVFPKIELKYGYSKFAECTPYIEYEESIYANLPEEDDIELREQNPDAEYDYITNSIILYYPKLKNKKQVIQALIHEYQHYLQSPSWMTRYYKMGYNYNNHPYELAATAEEKNWNKL